MPPGEVGEEGIWEGEDCAALHGPCMDFFGATEKAWQALDYFSNAQEKPDGPMCGQPNHVRICATPVGK